MSEPLELFIRVDENSNAVDHPIMGSNFCLAFPDIDIDNLPSNFVRFVRVPRPQVSVYDIANIDPVYGLVDGVFTDVWGLRSMTPEEKTAKQQTTQTAFIESKGEHAENFTAWVLDEATCRMIAPVERPIGDYAWRGSTNNWEIRATRPADEKKYKWNPTTWSWDEITL